MVKVTLTHSLRFNYKVIWNSSYKVNKAFQIFLSFYSYEYTFLIKNEVKINCPQISFWLDRINTLWQAS